MKGYRSLLVSTMAMCTFVELAIAVACVIPDRLILFDTHTSKLEIFFFLFHGTGALAGLLVFLWTPEARDYRQRRKTERANGSPPAAPA